MDRSVDGDRFAELVGALAETYRRDLTTGLIEGYWLALSDLSLADFERAARECMKSCQFMPVPAEIRERCAPNVALEAADEWRAVIGKFRGRDEWGLRPAALDAGRPRLPPPGPIAERVVKLIGGYETIGNRSEEENDTWTRKEFLRLYEEIASNPAAMESIAEGAPRLGAGGGSIHPAGWARMIGMACDDLGVGPLAKAKVLGCRVDTAELWEKLRSLRGRQDAESALMAWVGAADDSGKIGAGDLPRMS